MSFVSIFSQRERRGDKGKAAAEASFSYLDASARPEAAAVRQIVDDWFSRLPVEDRAEWLGRFRSENENNHSGAFFELMLHEWLLRLGYKVELHPILADTEKHPDFRAVHADGRSFYLEAKLTDGNSPEERRTERYCDQILDAVDKVESGDYFLDVRIQKKPRIQPTLRAFRDEIKAWLMGLEYSQVKANYERFGKRFDVGGGTVLLVPFAKHNRGTSGSLGSFMRHGVVEVDSQSTIQAALRRKASRYGEIDSTYVIAVNDLSEFFHEHHAYESLLGREVLSMATDGTQWYSRDNSGLFGNPAHPRHTRVSGALIVPGVTPWNFARRVPVFVAHPWAKFPAGSLFAPCSGHSMVESKFTKSNHEPSLADIFGLNTNWPGS